MPILRRILKYTPAAALGLLVVAWVVSMFAYTGIAANPDQYYGANIERSKFQLVYYEPGSYREPLSGPFFQILRAPPQWFLETHPDFKSPSLLDTALGDFYCFWELPRVIDVALPIPMLITALLPLGIAPFVSFRFRLWHYLAYTALIAFELAYYLRWQ